MPCFQGIAVSIHTPEGPIPEYSIQRISRLKRITSYIPVPKAKLNPVTNLAEQSTFAISITLLTPGNTVPYSTPKPTKDDPNPRPKLVSAPGDGLRGKGGNGTVIAYKPLTTSPNETIAAYIYFDGRPKEEVATLLRRGEETWVNSRWVSISDTEGGGLAEREFLFREVGLERWLNGLDLQGKDMDVAARIKRRRAKLEARRRIKKEEKDSDDSDNELLQRPGRDKNGVLRYGDNENAPVESLSDDGSSMSNSDSEDDSPMPEAAGQIKVALFRVLASGEIKRGEYSPHFDAHDDDDLESGPREDTTADVDHTTSFAKPKTLDPKSISTQTVSPIDMPDSPFAVFTFLYRGQRQLHKMGILGGSTTAPKTPIEIKRKSGNVDFSKLQPLKAKPQNYEGYRDANAAKHSVFRGLDKKRKDDDMDSDEDEIDEAVSPKGTVKLEPDEEDKDDASGVGLLSPEDAARQRDLAEGVKKINLLKRQASAEPLAPLTITDEQKSPSPAAVSELSPIVDSNGSAGLSAAKLSSAATEVGLDTIGSPFKRARASASGPDGSTVDVSGAKRASEIFTSSMFSAAGKNAPKSESEADAKAGEGTNAMDEEL
ncbi:hypothetical protein BT63DRAFT_461119 [Microthyrium microscopicum]|uniref:DUF7918 domain-containing protein n=1 Tax=Microthyrium microscopicum TaxID=703497 RepID=A0A6A6TW13_9PEZI|nr:hypothetical protein BT63DRAFT_461119 [Microthyrium microscopicum]